MPSKLSIYAKPTHGNAWLDYARGLQPYDILILDPDIQQVSDAHQASPNSEITIRNWSWDDGRSPQSAGIWNDFEHHPEELADWTADQYLKLIEDWEKEAKARNIPFPPRSQLVAHLANEPDSNFLLPQLNLYTIRAARHLAAQRIRVDGLNLGTGHPAALKDGKPDWIPLTGALQALAETGSYAVTHQYYNAKGIRDSSVNPWHVLRSHFAPSIPGLKWKVGEFGLEQLVNNLSAEHQGYMGIISNEQFLSDVEYELENLRDDEYALRIFMTDFEDRVWRTFNTVPIHPQLIALGSRYPVKPTTPPPPATTGPTTPKADTMYVNAPSGLFLRAEATADSLPITTAVYGDPVEILGFADGGRWANVNYKGQAGWMAYIYLADTPTEPSNPGPTPPVTPPVERAPDLTAILDPTVIEAILQVESSGSGFGADHELTIRFEAHIFADKAGNTGHFRYNQQKPWTEQQFRLDGSAPWRDIHTGKQADEYAAFELAKSINTDAAYNAISMGAPQIMGFNHAGIGYPSAAAMYAAFARSSGAQFLAMINYILRDPALVAAVKSKDFDGIARGYNGSANIAEASAKYKAAYESLGAA